MKQLSLSPALESEHFQANSIHSGYLSADNFDGASDNNRLDALQAQNDTPQPAKANVTEIIISEGMADNVQMILPMLNQLNQEKRWLAWIDPPIELLKKWKTNIYAGPHDSLNTDEIMVLRSGDKHNAMDLTRRALKTGTCHAAIVWTKNLSQEDYNSLEQASIAGNSHGIVLRYR